MAATTPPVTTDPRSHIPLTNWLTAAPDFGIAGLFLLTWFQPYFFDEEMVASLVLVMLMEFIIIHSSAFMGNIMISTENKQRKTMGMVLVGLFYTLFVAGFSLSFDNWWPIVAFWAMTLNRILFVLLGQAPVGKEKAMLRKSWAIGAMFYLLWVFPTTIFSIPRFGITPSVVSRQEFESEGLWADEPQTAMAFGFLYFTSFAISTLYDHRWLKDEHVNQSAS